jgi:hypothetical protein
MQVNPNATQGPTVAAQRGSGVVDTDISGRNYCSNKTEAGVIASV